jgi:hypothetical protein
MAIVAVATCLLEVAVHIKNGGHHLAWLAIQRKSRHREIIYRGDIGGPPPSFSVFRFLATASACTIILQCWQIF